MDDRAPLEAALAALEQQRAALGDAVVDAAQAPLRARLQALQGAGPSLRQVSVLFMDVVGSTELARQIDPEAVQAVMDGLLHTASGIVRAHGGAVLQYAGDSLLAAFGTPQAREDDAERAVRCGLALLGAGAELGARVLREHGHAGCHVRTGIHTGPVLLGGVDDAGTIRGVTVNLAARMEQTAPPGALRISQATWRQVRGAFDMDEQPPLMVKGHDAPMQTWLVRAARPRAFRLPARGIEGLETPMVGRAAELGQLMAAFERTLQGGQSQACTVLADAGLGKSRLLQELQHALDGHVRDSWLLLGRAQPGSQLQPYGLLREMLAWRLQIADSDSADEARRKLVQGLGPWLAPPAGGGEAAAAADTRVDDAASAAAEAGQHRARLLGQLIGMDYSASPGMAAVLARPRQLRDQALAALVDWLRALAARDGAPVVMLLDDLHWADDESLDALQHLHAAADLPLLLVMGARPSLLERRADWGQDWLRHGTLALAELAGPDQAELARRLLQRLGEVPATLLALVDRHAAGNPFYAEELVKMLIDDGVIEVGAEGWTLHGDRLRDARVPTTLTGVLQARLDTLGHQERRALQAASVVGPVFWDLALAELQPGAQHALPALQRRALVHARPGSVFDGTPEQAFQHHLLHQVTYETVLRADRRAGHARAAAWLAERVGERSAEYLAVVADHFERAGDHAQAFAWYERAVDEAVQRFAQTAVLSHTERALALPASGDLRRRIHLLKRRIFAADVLGERGLQAQSLQAQMELALQMGDEGLRADALASQALLADRVGDYERAASLAREAVVVAEACEAAGPAALGWGELAWLSRGRNDLDSAMREIHNGLAWARRMSAGNTQAQNYLVQMLSVLASLQGRAHQVYQRIQTLDECLGVARTIREARVECSLHEGLADAYLLLGDVQRAADHVQALDGLAERTGEVVWMACVQSWRATLAMLRDDHASALAHAQRALEAQARIGARHSVARTRVKVAAIRLNLGQHDAAMAELGAARQEFAAIADAPEVCACQLLEAGVLLARGDAAGAAAAVADRVDGLEQGNPLDGSEHETYARFTLWKVLHASADPRAAHQLAQVRERLRVGLQHVTDPAVRRRALAAQPLDREILQACEAAGLPLD